MSNRGAQYDHIIADQPTLDIASYPIPFSVPKSSYIYPKMQAFETNYDFLKTIGAKIPANLQRSYQAIMHAGQNIESNLDAGVTVSSNEFDNWLQLTKSFANHLGPVQAQPLVATADQGQAQPQDSITQPVSQAYTTVMQSIDNAWAELESVVASLPWGWIALGIGVVVVLPMAIRVFRPSPRSAARRRRSAATLPAPSAPAA